MPEIFIDDMQRGYIDWVRYVRENGRPRSPRGIPTLNVRDLTVILTNPTKNMPQYIGRKFSKRLAVLEALQLVGEASWPELMVKVAPNTAQFRNEEGRFDGAYGERVADATELVVRKLQEDRDTRQAVLTIYQTTRDLAHITKDVACTVALFFEIEDGVLHCKTMMRSNDVMWGVAYDVFQFTTLQRTIADFLGLGLGEYRHTAYSSHFYLRDEVLADGLHHPGGIAEVSPSLYAGGVITSWDEVTATARLLARGIDVGDRLTWWTAVSKTWVSTV